MIVIHTDVPSGGCQTEPQALHISSTYFHAWIRNGQELFSACLDQRNFSCGWNMEMKKQNAKLAQN